MDRCWILIGMMGSGKSAVGRALAEASGRAFVDTDQLLQQRFGRSVNQIFQVYGEEAFREHETSVLRGLEPGSVVLSTGGGIVCREANWQEFHRLGLTIYLEATLDTLTKRLEASQKKRPLLAGGQVRPKLEELMAKRAELYRKADCSVIVDGLEIAAVVNGALEAVRNQDDS